MVSCVSISSPKPLRQMKARLLPELPIPFLTPSISSSGTLLDPVRRAHCHIRVTSESQSLYPCRSTVQNADSLRAGKRSSGTCLLLPVCFYFSLALSKTSAPVTTPARPKCASRQQRYCGFARGKLPDTDTWLSAGSVLQSSSRDGFGLQL